MAEGVAGAIWWVRLPRAAGRWSAAAAFALADGHFLTAFPRVAAWLPPATFLVGLAAGAGSVGYERTVTESLGVLLAGAASGFVAANLGAAWVAGLALGDLAVAQQLWAPPSPPGASGPLTTGPAAVAVRVVVPLLISYALLAIVAVVLPRASRTLVADLPRIERLPPPLAFAVAAVLTSVTAALLVSLWTQTAAVLVRPVFTWTGEQPTVAAVAPLQESGVWLARAAVAATLARIAILWWLDRTPRLRGRAAATEAALGAPMRGPSAVLDRLPSPLRALGTAAGTTLLLAGMLSPWWLAAVLFTTVLLVRLLRDVHPAWLERWRATAAQVPALLRLGLGFVVVQGLATGVERAAFGGDSFAPVALFVAAAVLVFAAVLPGPPAARPSRNVAAPA